MSARLMEPGIASALASGRVVIVPTAQRAAALRWNWARHKMAEGRQVWDTPDIITWEAWLEAQWEKARLAGRVAAGSRRLNRSQQLQLWQRVLGSLERDFGEGLALAQHAAALMGSAAHAVQWLLPLSRLAVTDEERLLAAALAGAREWCQHHDCVAVALCTPAQLAQFVDGPPPLIAGQRRLTALQEALGNQCWPAVPLLHEALPGDEARVRLVTARNMDEEIRACAQWCEGLLAADPGQRLLVISATTNLSTDAQATLLARQLCDGTNELPEEVLENGLLAVEGGRALAHQQLIADALCALRLLREPLSFDDLAQVLGSPYLNWGTPVQMLALRSSLAEHGFAQWPAVALDDALGRLGVACPAALLFAAWLAEGRAGQRLASRMEWARRFSGWLGAARFARGADLDSRDAQRLQRWNELLDEFAALDASGESLTVAAALDELLQLAAQARHAAQSADAAITLTAERSAPLARYDGVWVLGLAEQRWPEPPRPDPYVPLPEQRRCGWDEAGARQRLEQAQWSLCQWRASTNELVLSYPQMEGDVQHRPSVLPGVAQPHLWEQAVVENSSLVPFSSTPSAPVTGFEPMAPGQGRPLRRGLQRLQLQQACAFRAQAQVRLGATPAPDIGDGIHPIVRGLLLHGLLDGLWRELGDQRALNALDADGRRALFERHWSRQIAALAAQGRPPYPPRVMERERLRSQRLIQRILAMEDERPFFRVLHAERQLQFATAAGVMSLRVDRLDEDAQGHRWLIDYKSGTAEVFRLAQGEAQPLQLALYEQALAAQDEVVRGMALLSLAPAQPGFSGAAAEPDWPGKWQQIPDWEVQRESWRGELQNLLREHVAGEGQVAPLRDACRLCHLPALCRRADPDTDSDVDAEEDDD